MDIANVMVWQGQPKNFSVFQNNEPEAPTIPTKPIIDQNSKLS